MDGSDETIATTYDIENTKHYLSYSQVTEPVTLIIKNRANDPTAGSPTVTLLRLLLPLDAKVH